MPLCIHHVGLLTESLFQAHQSAITAALHSDPGIDHVFYTSLGFAGDGLAVSAAHVMQAHLQTEAWLRSLTGKAQNLTFTAIREGIYSESYPMYTAFFDPREPVDEVQIPHNGKAPGVAWVAINDLGEASAKLVAEFVRDPQNKRYIDKIVLLDGPKDWTLEETVQVLARCAGKKVNLKQVPFDEHAANPRVVKALSSHGPGDAAKDWTTVFQAISNGETSVRTGELERLLGRPAETFESTVKRMLAS